MRGNKEIILNHIQVEYGDQATIGTFCERAGGYHIYDIINNSIKDAQVKAIKELVKRKWDDTNSMFMGGTGYPSKSLDQLALELIKEIEG